MYMDTQAVLANDRLIMQPLEPGDFEALYAVASDPKIWEQHPNRDRWKRAVFQVFFDGALQSKGAYKIIDKATGQIAGSTRFYDFDEAGSVILIGYTFYATQFWGHGLNLSAKAVMLDYAFQFVSRVHFHIGAQNLRSQIAIGRLGARKIAEQEVAYFGEPSKLNFVYELTREDWNKRPR